jgi:NitT/TauT family transport system substrate-binding protein
MRKKMSCLFAVFVVTVLVWGVVGSSASFAASPIDITFSLDFIVLGRHAPWYVALDKGYYKEEGLNVKIIPGQGTAQVIQAVESGLAEIGFVDVVGIVLGRAGGATVKMVAVNYQKPPFAIFSLDPGANVTKVKDLEGLEVGSSSGSFVPNVIKGFMKMQGLDPRTLKVVNVAPAAKASMLLSGQLKSIEFFLMSKPSLERGVKGATLRTFLLGDHGLVLYSNGIGAKEEYLKKNPKVVQAFVRASLRGWKDALSNPEDAADRQLKYAKGLDRSTIVAELGVLKNLAIVPDTQKNGLGWFDPAKMKASLEFVLTNLSVTGSPPKPEDLYATGFLPEPPVFP